MTACLTENDLLDRAEGRLSPERAAAHEAHLDTCTSCQELLAVWLKDDDGGDGGHGDSDSGARPALARTIDDRPALMLAPVDETSFPRGTRIGRYVILQQIGVGAMGLVYAAKDPELDRTVALKVLRADVSGAVDSEARTRLLREAQAMARVNHPNVAAVYDAGTIGERVFLAMEHLDGGTLLDWQLAHPGRSWREVLEVYLQAGRGLAAAHAEGLIHRDFKPENAILGRDHRVRVTDFGLARPLALGPLEPEPQPPRPTATTDTTPIDTLMTRAGAVIGTPAYMAPEQIRGEPADARSDQFSFCVALYEALHGARPFEADDLDAIAAKIQAGLPQAPEGPRARRIPPWLRRVLSRGLSARREERYPDMEALLAALGRDPARVWKRASLGGALALSVGVAAALAIGREARLCRGSERALGDAWDAARKEQVRAAFLATGKPHAQATWEQVARALDGYTTAWTAMRTEACEATRLRGEQPERVLALRVACLDRMRMELDALSRMFTRADGDLVTAAARAAAGLPDVRHCADTEQLLARAPPPTDPSSRERLEAVRASLAAASALLGAGRYKEGEAQARAQVSAARELGYAPVIAEALELHGRLQEKVGDPVAAAATMEEAELTAEASRDDALATRASAQLADMLIRQSELGRGQSWLRHGQASLQRSGGGDVMQARLLEVQSRALATAGDHEGAVKLLLSALELKERTYGPDHLEVAASFDLLARALKQPEQRPRALEFALRSLRMVEAALGSSHPDVADALMAVGQVHRDMEQFQQELECATRALAIRERALGPDHLTVASSRWSMGTALHNLGEVERSLEQFRGALAAFERAYGPDHVRVATVLGNIAGLQAELGEDEESLAAWQRILPVYERAFGRDRPQTIHALRGLAMALAGRRRFAEADAYLERAVAAGASLSPENPDLFYAYSDRAELLRLQGRFSDARAAQERAIGLLRKLNPDPSSVTVAAQQVRLGRLLAAEGKPEQALAVAQPARATLEARFGPGHRLLADALAVEGDAARALGQRDRAVDLLERAVRLRDQWRYRPEVEAESRFALARALGPGLDAPQRERARTLAIAAREEFVRAGDRQRAAAVGAWIGEGK